MSNRSTGIDPEFQRLLQATAQKADRDRQAQEHRRAEQQREDRFFQLLAELPKHDLASWPDHLLTVGELLVERDLDFYLAHHYDKVALWEEHPSLAPVLPLVNEMLLAIRLLQRACDGDKPALIDQRETLSTSDLLQRVRFAMSELCAGLQCYRQDQFPQLCTVKMTQTELSKSLQGLCLLMSKARRSNQK